MIVPDPVREKVLTDPVPLPVNENENGVCALAAFHRLPASKADARVSKVRVWDIKMPPG